MFTVARLFLTTRQNEFSNGNFFSLFLFLVLSFLLSISWSILKIINNQVGLNLKAFFHALYDSIQFIWS